MTTTIKLDGYIFYEYKDSFGSDLGYSDQLIPELKQIADSRDNCFGFNTLGFMKYKICDTDKFINFNQQRYQGSSETPGLYVKDPNYTTNKDMIDKITSMLQSSTPSTPTTKSEFDDYTFYPFKDSSRYDIQCITNKSINELKEIADNTPTCVGFNTVGYLKYKTTPVDQFADLNKTLPQYSHMTPGIYLKKNVPKVITVKTICDHSSVEELCKQFEKFYNNGTSWNNIRYVTDERADYYIIINYPRNTDIFFEPEKTIIFHMEPERAHRNEMYGRKAWGIWKNPDPEKFLMVRYHMDYYNNAEWHLNKNYVELMNTHDIPKTKLLSAIISANNWDDGHILRIKQLQYIEAKESNPNEVNWKIDIYGRCGSLKYKNYFGELPPEDKTSGLYPYKYTIAFENNSEHNYFTEKIHDAIVSECLPFYWGCPNLDDYFPNAYIRLTNDLEMNYQIIKTAIENNEWEKRLPYIKQAKYKILNELQISPTIEKIINDQQVNPHLKSTVPHPIESSIDINTFFDKIFIINLDKYKGRWLETEKKLIKSNVTNYERFSAKTGDDALAVGWKIPTAHMDRTQFNINFKSQLGCKFSHYNIIKIAKERGYKNVLIMEDDMEFDKNIIQKVNETLNKIKINNIKWETFYLYGSHGAYRNALCENVRNFVHLLSCACYAIDSSIYDLVINEIEKRPEYPIDDIHANFIHPQLKYKICMYPHLILPIIDDYLSTITITDITPTSIKNVCINIAYMPNRKQHMIDEFKKHDIVDYQFYKAIDEDNVDLRMKINELIQHFDGNNYIQIKNTVCNTLTHLNLWIQLINDNGYNFYFVTEDNIKLVDGFKDKFIGLVNNLNEYKNLDFLFLGNQSDDKNIPVQEDQEINITCFDTSKYTSGKNEFNTFGYIVSKKGAIKMIKYMSNNGIKHSIDHYFSKYEDILKLFQLEVTPQLMMLTDM